MFFWLTLSVLVFGVGEYLSKRWTMEPTFWSAAAIIIPYMAATWLWLPALKAGKNLSTTGVAWSVMSSLVTVCLGIFFFKEKLSITNYVGLVMAILSLILIQSKG